MLPRCAECWVIFANLDDWQEHRRSVHGSRLTSYQCQKCDYRATDNQILNQHLLSRHKIVLPRCLECDLSFETTALWQTHRGQVHLGDALSFKCKKCQFASSDVQKFKTHLRDCTFNKSVIKSNLISCQHCDQTFTSVSFYNSHALDQHVRIKGQLDRKETPGKKPSQPQHSYDDVGDEETRHASKGTS